MNDCRYPWERDPVNDPPHMAERFTHYPKEVIESLIASCKLAALWAPNGTETVDELRKRLYQIHLSASVALQAAERAA
jgi:hypothetical protein